MNDDDGIVARLRTWGAVAPYRVTIGDVTLEFPEGTTREQAQAALDDAKRLYLARLAAMD